MSDLPQRPQSNHRDKWSAYWKALGQPWRWDPEIDEARQQYLSERTSIKPNTTQGAYPFRDVALSRADIEWLLATHEDWYGQGPIDWQDPKQHARDGLDLRGADLRKTNLTDLPLAGIVGGLSYNAWRRASPEQREWAAVHMEQAKLSRVHLEGALLIGAHLEGTRLLLAHLEAASLIGAYLGTRTLEAEPGTKQRSGRRKILPPAHLRGAFFDAASNLEGVALGDPDRDFVSLVDVRWGGVNLAVIKWPERSRRSYKHVRTTPQLDSDDDGNDSELAGGDRSVRPRFEQLQDTLRANRQLATVLRAQGLSEPADRFAYRAQFLQRILLRRQRRFLRYLGSSLLDIISGYGYKPLRSVITYLLVILSFAAAYFALTNFALTPFLPSHSSPLAWYEAIVLSISSFHGRGLFPSGLSLGDPIAILAAFEAIIGLLIEITFIATFTQRFFAR